jgi:hypothetical protein
MAKANALPVPAFFAGAGATVPDGGGVAPKADVAAVRAATGGRGVQRRTLIIISLRGGRYSRQASRGAVATQSPVKWETRIEEG